MSSEFTVIIDVVGRASARWRGAKSVAEAGESRRPDGADLGAADLDDGQRAVELI